MTPGRRGHGHGGHRTPIDDALVCGGLTFMTDGALMVAGGPRVVADAATGTPLVITGVRLRDPLHRDAKWTRLPGNMTGVGGLTTGSLVPDPDPPGRRPDPGDRRLRRAQPVLLGQPERGDLHPVHRHVDDRSPPTPRPRRRPTTPTTPRCSPLPRRVNGVERAHARRGRRPHLHELGRHARPAGSTSTHPRPGAGHRRPTTSNGAGIALLPIRLQNDQWGYDNGSILTMGGRQGTTAMTRADVYDPVTDTWLPSIDTGTARHYPAPVLLPDGRVLLINGHDFTPDDAVLTPQYIDPANGFAVSTSPASGVEVRGLPQRGRPAPRRPGHGGRGTRPRSHAPRPRSPTTPTSPRYMTQPRPASAGPRPAGLRRRQGKSSDGAADRRGAHGPAVDDPFVRLEPALRPAQADGRAPPAGPRPAATIQGPANVERGPARLLHVVPARQPPGPVGGQDRPHRLIGAEARRQAPTDRRTPTAWSCSRPARRSVNDSTCSAWGTPWRHKPHAGVIMAWVRSRTGSHPPLLTSSHHTSES